MTDRPWGNSDMARPRKNNITIDEEIIKQEEQVSKSKAKYDADVKKLKDLYAKKDEIKKKELLEAVEKRQSNKPKKRAISARIFSEVISPAKCALKRAQARLSAVKKPR